MKPREQRENKNQKFDANHMICKAAESFGGMYLTDPAVEESKGDTILPVATQNEADTRQWCAEHQT